MRSQGAQSPLGLQAVGQPTIAVAPPARARRTRRAGLAAAAGLMVVLSLLAGCGSKSNGTTATPSSDGVRLYGTDGNMSNSFGAGFKSTGVITGMVGTTPLTQITADFKSRLRSVDPNLQDYNYAGETYDAVMISALAAQVAHSVDPQVVAKYITGVTLLAPGGVECSAIKDCLTAITSGKDIAYRGVSVHSGFTDAGEPSTTTYGTLHFGRNNKIDDGKTEFVTAGSDTNASKQQPLAPVDPNGHYHGDPLRLGLLLPKTGQLTALGPPMFAGAHLAVKEINEAGGILGKPVEATDGDDGTDVAKATGQFDKFASAGIPIIIGPPTSGESAALIPRAAQVGRILFSPSATSAALSTANDRGMFFRTSPPDTYQSQALADVIMRGGARRVFIVARADSYGTGLRDGVKTDLTNAGIKAGDLDSATYTDAQKDFGEIAKAVQATSPDAVLVIGYDESAQVIKALQAAGVKFAQS